MKTVDLIQGSPEWHAHRAQHFNASDAPAMMGCSPYKTRAALLREMHTGITPEVDIATQKRFDNGHRVEALARPLAERIVGQDLYPVTGALGKLSASFDGLTLDECEGFEHKALNEALRSAFNAMLREPFGDDARDGRMLPIYHRVQMEQQLHISGAERILFMASEWDADGNLIEERHCWYYPDAELRAAILQGWDQFAADLAAYVPQPSADPAPVGKAPETLPALHIEVTGAVTASNLAEFKSTALAAIRSVNRDLKTDRDFADADKAVKWCAEVESRLKAAKEHALSQTASIDALFKALDDIAAESKAVRLDLGKLIERRKVERKEEAVSAARRELEAHIAGLNGELAPMALRPTPVDFAGAIKGMRSFASMDDALQTAVANGKIAADAQAMGIRANLASFKKATGDDCALQALFADLGQIVHKAGDDFAALVGNRIAAHRQAEAAKEAKRQAEQAAAIAAAEAKAREEAAAAERRRIEEEQRQQARAEREAAEVSAAAAARALAHNIAPHAALVQQPLSGPRPIPQQRQPLTPDAAIDTAEAATLSLGVICGRLGFTVTAAFLSDMLHVSPARTDKAAKLYTESQYQTICRQLMAHVSAMAELYAGETA